MSNLFWLAKAEWLLADRCYDADWFRQALKGKGIRPCIPDRKSRGRPIRHDKRRYKRCNRIEIMFGWLKDSRSSQPVATGVRRSSFPP